MQEEERFRFVPPDDLPASETRDARAYWAGCGIGPYRKPTHWSEFIAERVLALAPRSVLEFGCNHGRNLVAITRRRPDVEVRGIDVNAAAVERGRADHELDLRVGDDAVLARLSDGRFDVVFTVSVLDHVPEPWPIVGDMLRVARVGVLLLEPWLGGEGRVVWEAAEEGGRDSNPFCYSWDYARFLSRHRDRYILSEEAYPLGRVMWGEHYRLFTARAREPGEDG
jgi:SAM-dependent methyltransferase